MKWTKGKISKLWNKKKQTVKKYKKNVVSKKRNKSKTFRRRNNITYDLSRKTLKRFLRMRGGDVDDEANFGGEKFPVNNNEQGILENDMNNNNLQVMDAVNVLIEALANSVASKLKPSTELQKGDIATTTAANIMANPEQGPELDKEGIGQEELGFGEEGEKEELGQEEEGLEGEEEKEEAQQEFGKGLEEGQQEFGKGLEEGQQEEVEQEFGKGLEEGQQEGEQEFGKGLEKGQQEEGEENKEFETQLPKSPEYNEKLITTIQ